MLQREYGRQRELAQALEVTVRWFPAKLRLRASTRSRHS
jgi:hypothetical protein